MARRPFPWKALLLAGGGALTAALIGGYLYAMREVVHAYYASTYAPEPLTGKDLGEPPAAHRLTDVPWLSETVALGPSISLRMLAAQQGRPAPRPAIDFFMGSTWGAIGIPGKTGFFPGQDPEPGLERAAPLLGFTRRYLTTDDREAFLRAVRTQLARGRAVRVAVDRASLLGERGFLAHSVVLVGYDAQGFEYYEPVCDDPKRCVPGEKPAGERGLTVGLERFLMAVEAQALAYHYPWTYQLLVLEPSAAPPPSPAALLEANGRALIGTAGAGPSTGAQAVRDVARAIERHGDSVVTPELLAGVRTAAVVRRDDAQALAALFPERSELATTAESLDAAAAAYARAARALEAKDLVTAVQALRDAALADLQAGTSLLPRPDAG
ncbi:MAG: BtrH N-terminal domain-containing protein [Myxococcota bacterium]